MRKIVPQRWKDWPDEAQMNTLCARADGHFQWAATTTKFIEDEIALDGVACRDRVLNQVTAKGMETLDRLYDFILKKLFPDTRMEKRHGFRKVVGCLVVLAAPLTIEAVRLLVGIPESELDVQRFFQNLRSVFVAGTSQVDDNTGPQMHKSFFEFITSERIDDSFRVKIPIHQEQVAQATFRSMETLRFNICDLETSHLPNDSQISASVVREKIQPSVLYSCHFWTHHLTEVPFNEAIFLDVKNFMLARFLFWLEVLSLTKQMTTARPMLGTLRRWIDVSITSFSSLFRFLSFPEP
jgi:hypothetical protein